AGGGGRGGAFGDGDAHEVAGEDDVAGVVFGGLGEEAGFVVEGVALGEVGEDEAAHVALGGDPGGLGRGEVAVVLGEVLLGRQERRLDDEEVHSVGEGEDVEIGRAHV